VMLSVPSKIAETVFLDCVIFSFTFKWFDHECCLMFDHEWFGRCE
jgi:hypothetical protein